jgi:hypothetical protein
MSRVKAQVVIGVAVLILSAAFLLVGVYFAQLQGLLFQNGANSLQLFANNIAAAKNALYTAPSSMTITLAGNNSMCTWSSAIDAYDCAGGSKVYNISYASGPTLDAGTNMFSMAMCLMVTLGPKTGVSEGESGTPITALSDVKESLPPGIVEFGGGLVEEDFVKFAQTIAEEQAKTVSEGAFSAISRGEEANTELGTISKIQSEESTPFQANPATSAAEVQNSYLGSLSRGLKKIGVFLKNHPHIRSLLTNVGLYVSSFWLGQTVASLDSNITNGLTIQDPTIPAFSAPSRLLAGQLLSTYITGEPVLSPASSALNLQVMQYSQLLVSAQSTQSIPSAVAAYNALQSAVGEAILQQNLFNEVAAYSSTNAAYNPYATPVSGVKVPRTLNSPNEFAGSATFPSPNDPLVSSPFFLAREAFVVYGQTASCLGVMPQSVNLNNALSTSATIYGEALSPLNLYSKINVVNQLGTYFLGYGGEVYINGQSNGRPTAVGTPVITDQADLCALATTNSQPGANLQTMVLPLNNGDVTLSVSQGLFNTMCSKNNVLFPKPVSDFVNKILSSTSAPKDISILLPPQYAIGITNSSKSSALCLYSVALSGSGSPISSGSASSLTEYGLPLSCYNITALTGGKEHLNFTAGASHGFSLTEIGKSAFFLNNNSVIGLSIPPETFVKGNFITGPTMQIKTTQGVNSPMLNLGTSLLGKFINTASVRKILNGAQTSIGSGVLNYIISSLSKPEDNASYYPTEYTNLTFSVSENSGSLNITLVSNNLIFGVYPNNYNSFGGTYGSGG